MIVYQGDGGGVPRKTAHIFAKDADSNDVTIFGSTLAGNTQYSSDLDDIQNESYEIGWRDAVISNKNYPLLADMNGVMLTFSQQLAYLLQHGLAGWDKDTVYYTYDLVNVNGVLYICTYDGNINNSPPTLNGWAVYYDPNKEISNLPPFCVNSGSIDSEGNGNCLQLPSGSTSIVTRNFVQPTLSANGTVGGDSFAVQSSGTYSASGSNHDTYHAFDNNPNTWWHSTSGMPEWITFYNPVELNVTKLTIQNPDTNNGQLSAGVVQASNDNSTWTDLKSWTNSVSGGLATWDIDLSSNTNSYKYYRIYITSSAYHHQQGNFAIINQINITATYEEEITSADNVILRGYDVSVHFTDAKGNTSIINNDIAKDLSSGYADGEYNVFLNNGDLEVYQDKIYRQPTQPGGENVATSANAITSGDYTGMGKANAFDGSLSTFWGCSQVGSTAIDGVAYIGQQNLTQPIKKVRLYQSFTGSQLPESTYCDVIKLQYSNDGTTWIDIQTVSNLTYQTWEEIDVEDYTPTDPTHSFRLLAMNFPYSTSGYNWDVAELELLTLEDNTVWLDTSVRPLTAYKYNGSIWEEYNGVPVGTCTVESNQVTAVKTFAYNVNGIENSLIKNYQNGASGYTLEWRYNSYNQKIMRYCIQYGAYSTGDGAKAITLLVSYGTNVNYFVSFEQHDNTATGDYDYVPVLGTNKTGSAFSFKTHYAYGGLWKAEGWIEE